MQVQIGLIEQIYAEQKLACQVNTQVIEVGIASEEFASTPGDLQYFQELRSLYDEGRYNTVLIQIYQLDKKSVLDSDEDAYDTSSI